MPTNTTNSFRSSATLYRHAPTVGEQPHHTNMDLAIRLNNIGCKLYDVGRYNDAYDLFAGAMQACYLFRERGSNSTRTDMFLVDPSIQRAFDILGCYGFTSSSGGATTSAFEPCPIGASNVQQDESSTFIRKEPFYIYELFVPSNPSYYFVLASLLFNNALLLHRQVVKHSKRSIERSITLYSMATESVFRTHLLQYVMGDTDRSIALLALSIVNNFGYALHQMNDYNSSRLCFSTLNNVLQQLGPPSSHQEKEQRNLFASNVFLFYESGPTPCAPAA